MAAQLLTEPVIRAIDANGLAVGGAKLFFFLSGTTVQASAYTTAALSAAHPNPLVADSGGLFPPVYLDPAVTYRLQLKTGGGVLIEDVDPVSFGAPAEASPAEVNAGVAGGKYVSPAGLAGWTGVAAALGYAPLNKAGDTATGLNLIAAAVPAVNAAGFLGLPVVTLNATADLTPAHNGRMVRHSDGGAHTWSLPPMASGGWVLATAIALRNVGSGVVTIARGSGVALRKGGSSVDADVALTQWGFAVLTLEDPDAWVAQGSGLS